MPMYVTHPETVTSNARVLLQGRRGAETGKAGEGQDVALLPLRPLGL